MFYEDKIAENSNDKKTKKRPSWSGRSIDGVVFS